MAVRHERSGGTGSLGCRGATREVLRAALLAALCSLLAHGSVEGQERSQLGTITAAGRVTYFGVIASGSSPWSSSFSAGRGLRDGAWESVALDVARRAWRSNGGSVGVRAIARYDRLKAPRGGMMAVEAGWHATRRLALSAACAWILDAEGADGRSPWFHGAVMGVKVQIARSFTLTAVVRYEATRGRIRTDLGLWGVR
jgi:hypothetical protein